MPNERTSPAAQSTFGFRESAATELDSMELASGLPGPLAEAARSGSAPKKRSLIGRASEQEWSVSILLLLLDVAAWFSIYGFASLIRGDAYYSSALVFFVVDLLQVTIIVTALYTIGGYDRSTETRSLVYATEHLLAIIVARGSGHAEKCRP